jgi:hypothetical protein
MEGLFLNLMIINIKEKFPFSEALLHGKQLLNN